MLAVIAALVLASPTLLPTGHAGSTPTANAPSWTPPLVAAIVGRGAPREPRQIVIELTELRPGAPPVTARYELALAPDGAPSRLETDDGPVHTRLIARQQLHETAESTLGLEIERERRGERGQPSERASFAMQARVAHDKRVRLGRAARGNAGALEVTVTLR